jgi:hypothetical protein
VKSRSNLPRVFAVVVATSGLVAGHTPGALACLNETMRDSDPQIQGIAKADQALSSGKYATAVEMVLRIFPRAFEGNRVPDRGPGWGINRLYGRGQRIAALAVVRTEGLYEFLGLEGTAAEQRRVRLNWAALVLRDIANTESKAPASQTELAEALSKLPETRGEALKVLEALDKKDLITSPQGFAALADLRREAGDVAGAEAAQKRVDAILRARPATPVSKKLKG